MERIKYKTVGENTKKMQKFMNIYIIFEKKKKKEASNLINFMVQRAYSYQNRTKIKGIMQGDHIA